MLDKKLTEQLKENGKGLGAKLDRARDVSDVFAQALVKSDIMAAMENQGQYVVRDHNGNAILINPRGGINQLSTANGQTSANYDQLQRMANSPMRMAKSQQAAAPDFRAIGKNTAPQESDDDKAAAFREFVESLTSVEIKNLKQLSRDRVLAPYKAIEEAHSKGEELGVERLIDNGLATWQKVEDMVEFRITTLGRRVLNSIQA